MTIVEDENAWEYNGVDLRTFAYDVRALGAPEQVPGRRGENVIVSGRTGRLYVPKMLDQRRLTLGMWVDARPPGGGERSAGQLWSNLDNLKKLFATDGQGILKHTAGGTTRWARVEVANTVEFEPGGPYHYNFLVEFIFADPFWYAESPVIIGPRGISFTPYNIGVNNPGTYKAEKVVITVTGEMTNPRFTVGQIWVQYNGTVAGGETLIIDGGDWKAEKNGVDATKDISHDGAIRWLELPVGISTLTVTGTVGSPTPTVKVEFTPVYI
jgi:hypothetical protein